MTTQASEDVVAVLPDRLGDDQRRVGIDALEHVHAHALAVNEPVLESFVVVVRPFDRPAFTRKGGGQLLFEFVLCRPTHLTMCVAACWRISV